MTDSSREPSAASPLDLFTRLVEQMSLLFRKEVQLARAELTQSAGRIGSGLTTMAIGGVLAVGALVILLQAAVAWLAQGGLDPRWGGLVVGVAAALVAALLIRSGLAAAGMGNLTPRRTAHQLREDAAIVKGEVR